MFFVYAETAQMCNARRNRDGGSGLFLAPPQGMPAPSGPLRAIHEEISSLVSEFNLELARLPRDRGVVAKASALVEQAEQLLRICFEIEETIVFPAIAPWLSGWNGPLSRELAEHTYVRRALRRYRAAAARALCASSVEEDWRVLRFVHGHELAARLDAHAGKEDGYILRVADVRLRGELRKRVREAVESALVRRKQEHDRTLTSSTEQ
jgi:hypothetical protein